MRRLKFTRFIRGLKVISQFWRNMLVNSFMEENKVFEVKPLTEGKNVSLTKFPEVATGIVLE